MGRLPLRILLVAFFWGCFLEIVEALLNLTFMTVVFVVMTTWRAGMEAVRNRMAAMTEPAEPPSYAARSTREFFSQSGTRSFR